MVDNLIWLVYRKKIETLIVLSMYLTAVPGTKWSHTLTEIPHRRDTKHPLPHITLAEEDVRIFVIKPLAKVDGKMLFVKQVRRSAPTSMEHDHHDHRATVGSNHPCQRRLDCSLHDLTCQFLLATPLCLYILGMRYIYTCSIQTLNHPHMQV